MLPVKRAKAAGFQEADSGDLGAVPVTCQAAYGGMAECSSVLQPNPGSLPLELVATAAAHRLAGPSADKLILQ